jgi:phage host-nuclease inhibitor protein Gam
MNEQEVLELFEKKMELLDKMHENQIELERSILRADTEMVEKRVDMNDYYIRQINQLNEKLEPKLHYIPRDLKDKHNELIQTIMKLSKANIDSLNVNLKSFKKKALGSTKTKDAHKIYVSNLK